MNTKKKRLLVISLVSLSFALMGCMSRKEKRELAPILSDQLAQNYLLKPQNYQQAITSNVRLLGRKNLKAATREAIKLHLARLYYATAQQGKAFSLYQEIINTKPKKFTAQDVNNYVDLLKRNHKISQANLIVQQYGKKIQFNKRFDNLKASVQEYYFLNAKKTNPKYTSYQAKALQTNIKGNSYGVSTRGADVFFISTGRISKIPETKPKLASLYRLTQNSKQPFKENIGEKYQIGPASFYDNGEKVIFTTSKQQSTSGSQKELVPTNMHQTHLAYSELGKDQKWTTPKKVMVMSKNKVTYASMHPSVTPDGSRLYFASNMPGGYGGLDIYYADWDAQHTKWGQPVNMGEKVNTNGHETYPSVVQDMLYFASNGQKGFGGYDIFAYHLSATETPLAHLPYPINTEYDDANPALDQNGQRFYFTSDRSQDRNQVYSLDLASYPMRAFENLQPKTMLVQNIAPATVVLPKTDLPAELVPEIKTLTPTLRAGSWNPTQNLTAIQTEERTGLFEAEAHEESYLKPAQTLNLKKANAQKSKYRNRTIYFKDANSTDANNNWDQLIRSKLQELVNDVNSGLDYAKIRIAGFAQVSRSEATNKKASFEIALYTKNFLRSQGIPENKIETIGYGASRSGEHKKNQHDKEWTIQTSNKRCEITAIK